MGRLVNLYEEYLQNQRNEQIQRDILGNVRNIRTEQLVHNFIVEDYIFHW